MCVHVPDSRASCNIPMHATMLNASYLTRAVFSLDTSFHNRDIKRHPRYKCRGGVVITSGKQYSLFSCFARKRGKNGKFRALYYPGDFSKTSITICKYGSCPSILLLAPHSSRRVASFFSFSLLSLFFLTPAPLLRSLVLAYRLVNNSNPADDRKA